jgi:toxin FitB
MNGYLLDTNCISEVVRPRPEPRVMNWLGAADEALLFLSVLTLGEIRKGVASLAQSRRRTLLETWLNKELQARFSGRILTVDRATADRWGLLAAAAKKNGRSLSTIDGLLAATAFQHNLTIVSRNENDFGELQVQILNPWMVQDRG